MLLLCATIFACFVYELAAVKPAWLDVAKGFIPRAEIITNPGMLYTAIGIVGGCARAGAHACMHACMGVLPVMSFMGKYALGQQVYASLYTRLHSMHACMHACMQQPCMARRQLCSALGACMRCCCHSGMSSVVCIIERPRPLAPQDVKRCAS